MKWPRGFSSAGVACGIKSDGVADLGVLVAEAPVRWAGTFTTNAAAAAPVVWSRAHGGKTVRAIAVNSGNANACTGSAGVAAVEETARAVGASLGCSADDVLIASTGPIGVALPVDKVVGAIPAAAAALTRESDAFAHAILTTDSGIKRASASVGDGSIVGVAKGAAMMAPNMATMLAFIVSDVSIEAGLAPTLGAAVEESFNRVSIDGCESTNDSVFLMTSADRGTVERREFSAALASVCASLAEQIAADAEGAKRLVRIRVSGARDDASAASLGRAVAASALWRAAVYGADPNWGRVVSALGSHDRALDMAAVHLWIGSELVFAGGEPVGSLEAAAKFMDADGFTVACVVGAGPGSAEVLSADLSPDYVTLNAFGTT